MADWRDIEQLQLDLKRAQESSAAQKLSERNCVEILIKLQKMNLLEIMHTMDGKEYITPAQLTQEIKDELYIHGGRVSLVELQNILNVDYSHIESKANDIVSSSNAIFLVLGQLVDKTYLDHLAEEINDTLQSLGQVKIADLCKTYDLPGEFLVAELVARLGDMIDGRLDENSKDAIFTETFIAQHKSRVRGKLTAITRPTALHPILGDCNISSKLFYSLVDELIMENRIKGDVMGKRTEKATFLPEMYVRTQNQAVDNFYHQNGYLEYEMLTRLGISDAKSYAKRRFKDLVPLTTVAIGPTIIGLVSASIDETIASGGWIDVEPLLPSPFSSSDCEQILSNVLKDRQGRKKELGFVKESNFASAAFEEKCKAIFEPLIKVKAEISAKDATVFALTEEEMELYSSHMGSASKKIESKEDTSDKFPDEGQKKKREKGAAGSGIGGREVKTRGKDKKRLKKQRELEAAMELEEGAKSKKHTSNSAEAEFMTVRELTEELIKNSPSDCPGVLLEAIAERLHRPLNKAFQELSKSVFQLRISEHGKQSEMGDSGSGTAPVVSSQKKSRKVYEEEINNLWTNAKLFNDAYDSFGDDTAVVMRRHLLKTLCTDVANVLFNTVGSEYLTGLEESNKITPEIRIKILTRLPEEYHAPLKKLHQTLTGKSFEEFNDALAEAASPKLCAVMLKKLDKKRERQVLHGYKMSLIQQLEQEADPATAFHLAVAVIFQNLTGKMLHMSGKCVPHVVLFLRSYLSPDTYEQLSNFQTLVIQSLGEDQSETQNAIALELPKLRTLAATIKKSSSEQ